MKGKSLLLVILSIAILLPSGASAKFDAKKLAAIKNVAVVSIYCDRRIDTSDFGGLASLVSELAQNKKFKLQPVAERMKEDVFGEYSKHLPFDLIAEEKVINNQDYQNIYNDVKVAVKPYYFSTPEGYKGISIISKKTLKRLFEIFPDVDAVLIMAADFKLDKVGIQIFGFGVAKVKATVRFYVIDKKLKKVLRKYNFVSSTNKIKFAMGGIFDADEIQPLCVEAANKAAKKIKNWIQKNLSKNIEK